MHKEIIKEMLKLATSGFGLVAALAWNELIKEVVTMYIKPLVGGASGIISLAIYAVLVTCLAVLVTYNLTRFSKKES
jgi:small-conductance mechanosensitive channel